MMKDDDVMIERERGGIVSCMVKNCEDDARYDGKIHVAFSRCHCGCQASLTPLASINRQANDETK